MIGLVLLLLFAGLLGLYWNVRYGGDVIEGDATRLTLAAEGSLIEGRVEPSKEPYHAGFGYPSTLAMLSALTGMDVRVVQLQMGFWLIIFALIVFLCYREVLAGARLALLATFLLLIQPDFLFYILRGSHEKQTWLLMILMLFILARSYHHTQRLGSFAIHVGLFYLVFWSMISTTAYFASTILFSLTIAFLFGWTLFRLERLFARPASVAAPRAADTTANMWVRRFFLSGAIGVILVYVFINYVYPPAVGYYDTLQNIADRVSALILGAEKHSAPYAAVQRAWVSPTVYLGLVAIQLLIALCGAAAWLGMLWRWLRGGWSSAPRGIHLLWLLYSGFALQLVLGIGLDFAGLLGLNLQLRLFAPLATIGSPLAALFIKDMVGRLDLSTRAIRWVAVPVATLATVACLLKVTNDPLVSNLWTFYTESEVNAQDWVDENIFASRVWLDIWPHQLDIMQFRKGYAWETNNIYVGGLGETDARYIVLSSLTRLQANRSGEPIPSVVEHNRIFDNGGVQIYQRPPRTPFQN